MSLNNLRNSNFGILGGPWHGLHRPRGHYMGPHGCSSTRIVTKSSPKPTPGVACVLDPRGTLTSALQRGENTQNLSLVCAGQEAQSQMPNTVPQFALPATCSSNIGMTLYLVLTSCCQAGRARPLEPFWLRNITLALWTLFPIPPPKTPRTPFTQNLHKYPRCTPQKHRIARDRPVRGHGGRYGGKLRSPASGSLPPGCA